MRSPLPPRHRGSGATTPAAAMTYLGAAVEDRQMPVRLQVGADGTGAFEYARVMIKVLQR